jgi:hypothetical protein
MRASSASFRRTEIPSMIRFARVVPFLIGCSLAAQMGFPQLWSNPWSNYTTVPSRSMTNPASDLEAADDFDVQGLVTRVAVSGNGCFSCATPVMTGATVRFYAAAGNVPGALLHESFLPAGAPGLQFDANLPEGVAMTLPTPFVATGRHFVSMQVHFQGAGTWGIWASGVGAYTLAPVQVRDRLLGTPWTQAILFGSNPLFADLTFRLFGQAAGTTGPASLPCTTWEETPTAMPAGATYCLLRGVKAFAPNDVWAVGSAQVPLVPGGITTDSRTVAMHFDGAQWTHVPTPSPGPAPGLVNCLLYALDGVSSNDLWAGGTWKTQIPGGWVGQQVFAMHWDGSAWTVPPGLPIPASSIGAGVSGSRILDIEAEASSDVWFVGDWLDIVSASSGLTTRPGLLLHWDGAGLQQTVLPIVTNVGHQYFTSVAANGPNDVWVAGGAGVVATLPGSSVPVLFHFDGSTWTHTPCPTPPHPGWIVNLHAVELVGTHALVFGVSSTQLPTPQHDPFLAHWNGSAWSLLPGPPLGAVTIEALAPNEIYAVGSNVWRFDGVAWTVVETFATIDGGGTNAIDAFGACGMFAVGGQSPIGQIAPFAARVVPAGAPHATLRLAAPMDRAPAALLATSPARIGTTLQVTCDDPSNALGTSAGVVVWALAATPAAGYPAPVALPFGGRGGSAGALFVDVATTGLMVNATWASGTPSPLSLAVPLQPAFVGIDVFTQAALLDTVGAAGLLLSNGLDLRFGF